MKYDLFFYKASLFKAIEKDNTEIVKLLISNQNIDINLPKILISMIL